MKENSREDAKARRREENEEINHPTTLRAASNSISQIQNQNLRAFAPSREPSSFPLPAFPPSREPLNIEEISAIVVDCAYKLHVEAGPGLLESVYEVVLAKMLEDRGLRVKRQVPVPIELCGLKFEEGFRADLIVGDALLIELKSVENLLPVHSKQVLTYIRLLKMPLGLLINFGNATFKEGIKRIANQHQNFASSRLRMNQKNV